MNDVQSATRTLQKLRKLAEQMNAHKDSRQFGMVFRVPVSESQGLTPGLYRIGHEGSPLGAFVWDDPAQQFPREWIASWGVEYGPEHLRDEDWHPQAHLVWMPIPIESIPQPP